MDSYELDVTELGCRVAVALAVEKMRWVFDSYDARRNARRSC